MLGAFGELLAVEEKFSAQGVIFHADRIDESAFRTDVSVREIKDELARASNKIAATRPTAVNLFWALERMRSVCSTKMDAPVELMRLLHAEALAVYNEDIDMCRMIGVNGRVLLEDNDSVITHCNTGGLATSGYGTALGVVFAAAEEGKNIHVYAGETRPLLQGARLTAWECVQRKVDVTVIADGMTGHVVGSCNIACAIVGADRIAANGDTANKIGTLSLAIISRHYNVPFYVAAPSSTIDPDIKDGSEIPIEERSVDEIKQFAGVRTVPDEAGALNPAFDVTPANLIAGIITEKKIYRPPFGGWQFDKRLPRANEVPPR